MMMKKYDINTLKDGWNNDEEGEEFYYISNPALGLWAVQSRFDSTQDEDTNKSSVTSPVETAKEQVASNNSGGVGGWKKSPSSD